MSTRPSLLAALFCSAIVLANSPQTFSDDVLDGSRTVDGNLIVTGDLTVTGDLVVRGRIVAAGRGASAGRAVAAAIDASDQPGNIFVELWRLDQQHNGLSVTLRGNDGQWEDEDADIRLDEQGQSLNPNNDAAPMPLVKIEDESKLTRDTWQTVRLLFDNYDADESGEEDDVGENATEDTEIDNFLNAIVDTDVMQRSLEFINQQDLHPDAVDLTEATLRDLLKRQWFKLYTNHYSTPKKDNSGFEHVFVGDHNDSKIGGHHFWWKFFLDQQDDKADSIGHKYKGPQGQRYPWIATFRMRWQPESGINLIDPDQKGFFVGCSPELMIAYGTLGLLMEKKSDGAHSMVTLDKGRFELTIHANTVAGPGDPDDRRGDQIKSAFPKLKSVAATGPGLDLTVAEALAIPNGQRLQVMGVIADFHNEEFGMKLADTADSPNFLAVKLPKSFRSDFNSKLNPEAKGTRVVIHGRRGNYTGIAGIIDVTHVEALQ